MPKLTITIDTDEVPPALGYKLQTLANTTQEFFNWVVESRNDLVVQGFFVDPDTTAVHNAQQMLARLETVVTNATAVISGHHKELMLAAKHKNKQRIDNQGLRRIHFGVRGDLAVDYGGGYGKAVQSKSCFSDATDQVDEHIKVAALQLTGERLLAETPGAADRRIIDITIASAANTWPLTPTQVLGNITPSVTAMLDRIHTYVSTYVQNKRGYNKWHELDARITNQYSVNQAGRPISRVHMPNQNGQNEMTTDFVTKIRWNHPKLVTHNTQTGTIRELVVRTAIPPLSNQTTTYLVALK